MGLKRKRRIQDHFSSEADSNSKGRGRNIFIKGRITLPLAITDKIGGRRPQD
jgi:hypothetical protein